MKHVPPDPTTICAVVVTFRPSAELLPALAALAPQVAHIVIVDNGSSDPITIKDATFISNKENRGQGVALNQGIKEAYKRNFSWVLLMDQDSLADPAMVQELIKAYYTASKHHDPVGLIGVNFTYRTTGRLAYNKESAGRTFFKRTGIQISGSLLSLAAYQSVGPFREDFFIDYIDTEYCLRLHATGFAGIIAYNAHMAHGLGQKGKYTATANYSPLRRYYRTRNELVLIKEYALKNPWWTLKHIGWSIFIEWRLILLTEDHRWEKIKAAVKGIKDAFTGRMGQTIPV